jgi:hypothetical protein
MIIGPIHILTPIPIRIMDGPYIGVGAAGTAAFMMVFTADSMAALAEAASIPASAVAFTAVPAEAGFMAEAASTTK